jgi:hypothetical protein
LFIDARQEISQNETGQVKIKLAIVISYKSSSTVKSVSLTDGEKMFKKREEDFDIFQLPRSLYYFLLSSFGLFNV